MIVKVISLLLMLSCAHSAVRKEATISTIRLQEDYPKDIFSHMTVRDDVELECKASTGNTSEAKWFFRKNPLDGQIELKTDYQSYVIKGMKLQVSNQDSLSGYYQCLVDDGRSKDLSRPALLVSAAFTATEVKKENKDVVNKGYVRLRCPNCTIFNFPEVKKHNYGLPSRTYYTVTTDFPISPDEQMWGDIFLSYVNRKYDIWLDVYYSGTSRDRARYKVSVRDGSPPTDVEVFFPPKSIKELHVFSTHRFELFALFTTRPPQDFDYKWTFPNTKVRPDKDYFPHNSFKTKNYVMFNRAGPQHNGKYKCCAYFKGVQQGCAEFTILIVYKPELLITPENIYTAAGKDAVFTVQARNRPPKPKTTWYINGELAASARPSSSATENRLIIKNVKWPTDIVNVQCLVANRYGTAFKSAVLYVFKPPVMLSGPDALTFSQDKSEITCGFERHRLDTVVVNWFFDNKKISPNDKRFSYKGTDKDTLVLKTAGNPNDQNKYSCQVKSIQKPPPALIDENAIEKTDVEKTDVEKTDVEKTVGPDQQSTSVPGKAAGKVSGDKGGATMWIAVGAIVGVLLLLAGAYIVRRTCKMGGQDVNLDVEDNEQAEETLTITKKLMEMRKVLQNVASEGGDHADAVESLAEQLGELEGELRVIAMKPGNLEEKENIGKKIQRLNLDLQQLGKQCSGSEGEKLVQLSNTLDDHGKRVAELAQTRKVVEEKLLSHPVSKGEDANTSAKGLAELGRLLKVMSEKPDENIGNVGKMVYRLKEIQKNIDLYSEDEGSAESKQLGKLGEKLDTYIGGLEELVDDEELDEDDMISFAQKLAQLSKGLAIVGMKCSPTSAHKKGRVEESSDAIAAPLKALQKYEKKLQELVKIPGDHSKEIAKIGEEMQAKCQELQDTSRAIGGEEGKKLKELSAKLQSKLLKFDENASTQEIAKLSTLIHEEIDNLAEVGMKCSPTSAHKKGRVEESSDAIAAPLKALQTYEKKLQELVKIPGDHSKEIAKIGEEMQAKCQELQDTSRAIGGEEGKKLKELSAKLQSKLLKFDENASTQEIAKLSTLIHEEIDNLAEVGMKCSPTSAHKKGRVEESSDAIAAPLKALQTYEKKLQELVKIPGDHSKEIAKIGEEMQAKCQELQDTSRAIGGEEGKKLKELSAKLQSKLLKFDENASTQEIAKLSTLIHEEIDNLAEVGIKCSPTSAHKKGRVEESSDAIAAPLKALQKYEKKLQELAKIPGDHSKEIAKIGEEMQAKCQELQDTSRAIGGEEGKKLKELSSKLQSKLLKFDENASTQEIAKLSTLIHEEIDNLAEVGKKVEKKTLGKDVSKKGKYGNPTDEIVVTLSSFRESEKKLQELAKSPGNHSKQVASIKREMTENCQKLSQLSQVIGGEEGKKLEALAEKLDEKFSDLGEQATSKEMSMTSTLLHTEIGALSNIGVAYDKKKRASITHQIAKGTAAKSERKKQAPEDVIPGNIKHMRSLKVKLQQLSSSKGDHSIEMSKIREEILVCSQELSGSLQTLGGEEGKLLMSIVNDTLVDQVAASLTQYSMSAEYGNMADVVSGLDRAIEGVLGVGIAYGKKKLLSPEDQMALANKQMLDIQRKLVLISKNPTKNSQAEVGELQRELEGLCESTVAISKNLGGSEGKEAAKFTQQLQTMASKLTKLGSKADSPEFAELAQQQLAVINQINDVGRGKKKKFQTGDQLASLVVKLRSTQKELLSLSKAPADNEEAIEKAAVQLGAYAELLKVLQSKVDPQEAKNLSAMTSRLESFGVTLATGGGHCSRGEIVDIAKSLLTDVSEYDRIAGIQQEKEEEEPEWRFHEEQEDQKEVDDFVDVMHKIKIPKLFH